MFEKQIGIAHALHLHQNWNEAENRNHRNETQRNCQHPNVAIAT